MFSEEDRKKLNQIARAVGDDAQQEQVKRVRQAIMGTLRSVQDDLDELESQVADDAQKDQVKRVRQAIMGKLRDIESA